MAAMAISDAEREAMAGLPHAAVVLYVLGIRPYMDYATGIVGRARRVSWQSLSEALYVDPHQGLADSGATGREQVRRLAQWLVKAGLVESASEGKCLIFKCLLASTDESVQKKADRKPTVSRQVLADTQADTQNSSEIIVLTHDADTQPDRNPTGAFSAKADTPPVSVIRERLKGPPSLRSGASAVAESAEIDPPAEPADAAVAAPLPSKRSVASPAEQEARRRTWDAYRSAYFDRYGVEPIRNQRTNSIVVSIVKRLGVQDAPEVVRYFVGHSKAYYVQSTHDIAACLKDAEGLRTQWATGRSVTSASARQTEQTETNIAAADAAKALLRRHSNG